MLPKILLEHRLNWEYSTQSTVYRLVAVESAHSFDGVDYRLEQSIGVTDAMGNVIWEPVESFSLSLAIAAIGQYLLTKGSQADKGGLV